MTTPTTSKDAADAPQGPFTHKETTTYKISNLEVSITRDLHASHAPSGDCGCGGKKADGGVTLEDLATIIKTYGSQLAELIMQRTGGNEH